MTQEYQDNLIANGEFAKRIEDIVDNFKGTAKMYLTHKVITTWDYKICISLLETTGKLLFKLILSQTSPFSTFKENLIRERWVGEAYFYTLSLLLFFKSESIGKKPRSLRRAKLIQSLGQVTLLGHESLLKDMAFSIHLLDKYKKDIRQMIYQQLKAILSRLISEAKSEQLLENGDIRTYLADEMVDFTLKYYKKP